MQYVTSISNDDKVSLLKAMGNSDHNLLNWCLDNPGEPILMKDILFQPVQMADDETGEITDNVRLVVIDKDGTSYSAVSVGAVSSMQRLISVMGQPPYADGLAIIAKQVPTRKGFKTTQIMLWEAPKPKAKK